MSGQQPFVSVITPVLNEERYIRCYLDGVTRQTYPGSRYEILLADGGSTDGTGEIIREFQAACAGPRIRLWVLPGTRRERRLNCCVREARGGIVARIDAHSVVAPDYLATVAALFANPPMPNLGVVGGPVHMLAEGYLSQAVGLAMQSRFGVGHVEFRRPDFEGMVATVQNASYLRRVFDGVGEFDEEIGCEDSEFHYRVRQAGYGILVTPRLRFHYFPRRTVAGLARQFANYGRWRMQFFRKYRKWPSLPYVAPLLFAAGVASAPFLGIAVAGLQAWLGLGAGLYAMAAVLSALKAGGRTGLRFAPLVAVLYPVMHIAYGAGMWAGIVSSRWRSPARTAQPSREALAEERVSVSPEEGA